MAIFGSSDNAESSRRKGVKKAPGGDDGIDWAALSKQTGFTDAVAAAVDALSSATAAVGSPPAKGKAKARSSMGSAGERRQGGAVPALINILKTLSRTFMSLSPGQQRTALWALLAFSVLYIPGLWTIKVALLAGLLLFKPLEAGQHHRDGGHRGGIAKKRKQKDAKGQWFSDDPLVAALQRIPETVTFANVGSPDPSSSSAGAAPAAPWSPPMSPSPAEPPSPPLAPQRRPHAVPPPPLPPSVVLPDSAFFTPMLPPSSPPPRHQMPSSRSEPQQLNFAGIGTPRLPTQLQHPAATRHPLQAIVGDQVGPHPSQKSQAVAQTWSKGSTTPRVRHVTSPHVSHDSPSQPVRSQFRLPSLPPSLPPPEDPHRSSSGSPSPGPSYDNPWEKRPSGSFHRIAVAKKAWKRAFSSPSKEERGDVPASLVPGIPADARERYEQVKGTGVFDDEEGEWVDEYGRRVGAN